MISSFFPSSSMPPPLRLPASHPGRPSVATAPQEGNARGPSRRGYAGAPADHQEGTVTPNDQVRQLVDRYWERLSRTSRCSARWWVTSGTTTGSQTRARTDGGGGASLRRSRSWRARSAHLDDPRTRRGRPRGGRRAGARRPRAPGRPALGRQPPLGAGGPDRRARVHAAGRHAGTARPLPRATAASPAFLDATADVMRDGVAAGSDLAIVAERAVAGRAPHRDAAGAFPGVIPVPDADRRPASGSSRRSGFIMPALRGSST